MDNEIHFSRHRKRPFFLAVFLVRHPYIVMTLSMTFCVSLSVAALFYPFIIDSGTRTFDPFSGEIADNYHAFLAASEENKRGDLPSWEVAPSQSAEIGAMFLLFISDPDYENILFPPRMDSIITLENIVFDSNDFSKYELKDVYGNRTGFDSMTIDLRNGESLESTLNNLSPKGMSTYLVQSYRNETKYSKAVRTIIRFGSPLEGYNNINDRYVEQRKKVEDWVEKNVATALNDREDPEVEVLFMGTGLLTWLINQLLIADSAMAAASLLFVFCYLCYHLRSFFLASLGMTHALVSFPTAYAIYRIVFRCYFMNILNFLGLFVLLGIAADDIFIVADAFKQSAMYSSQLPGIESRMSWSLTRASKAMLITTMTTAAAFLSNALSPIRGIRDFGVFMGTLIIVDYLLVVTWFPAVVVLWSRRSEDKYEEEREDVVQPVVISERQFSQKLRFLERFFRFKYSKFVHKKRKILVIMFIILSIAGGIMASQMETSTNPSRFLPEDHIIMRFAKYNRDVFYAQGSSSHYVHFVFGIKGIDRSNLNPEDIEDLGDPVFYDSSEFDPSSLEVNEWLRQRCGELRNDGYILGIDDAAGQRNGVTCFAEGFYDYCVENNITSECFGSPESHGNRIIEFCKDSNSPYYHHFNEMVAVDRGTKRVKWFQIRGQMNLKNGATGKLIGEYYDNFEDGMDRWNYPTGMQTSLPHGFHTSKIWVWMEVERLLKQAAIFGICFSLIFVFVVVIISTLDIVVSLIAMTCIGGIVAFVIGFVVLLGWRLGVAESICLVILVGVTVDYTLHLAHAFMESRSGTRFERAQDAVSIMGISVFSASITTMGSCFCLFFATVLFFQVFGQFVFVAIATSVLFAFGFFIPMCMWFAPETDACSLKMWISACFCRSKKKGKNL